MVIRNNDAPAGQFNQLQWNPPPLHCFKLNMDAGSSHLQRVAGLIWRSSNGTPLYVAGYLNTFVNAQVAEAWAVLQALCLIHKVTVDLNNATNTK